MPKWYFLGMNAFCFQITKHCRLIVFQIIIYPSLVVVGEEFLLRRSEGLVIIYSYVDQGVIRNLDLAAAEGSGKHQRVLRLQLASVKEVLVNGFQSSPCAVRIRCGIGINVCQPGSDRILVAANYRRQESDPDQESC